VTGRSTGRKILQSIGVVATWAAVVGLGTFGTFSDPATPLSGIRDDAPPHERVLGGDPARGALSSRRSAGVQPASSWGKTAPVEAVLKGHRRP
jgi:hypothetical protein